MRLRSPYTFPFGKKYKTTEKETETVTNSLLVSEIFPSFNPLNPRQELGQDLDLLDWITREEVRKLKYKDNKPIVLRLLFFDGPTLLPTDYSTTVRMFSHKGAPGRRTGTLCHYLVTYISTVIKVSETSILSTRPSYASVTSTLRRMQG